MEDLTPSQKAKLHVVANLMLEIYRTLVRMRYLDPSGIIEGPHDITDLLPMYHSHGLDASIIYLYSILPYIDPARAGQFDFFQGGEFADFRQESDVEQGRDPFYANSEEERLRPWMTPLSMMGNHRSVILYNARKHCIGIYDQECCGSTDHNLYGKDSYEKGEKGEMEVSEDEEDEDEEDEDEEDEDGEDEDEEDEEVEEDEENCECVYDEMDSRPAGNVLRDIIKWYHELIEVPGGGEHSGLMWDSAIVKPLYRKHCWPSANFDGDAFLVDQARAAAAASAKGAAEEPIKQVWKFQGWLHDEDSWQMRERRDKLAAAKTDEGQWLARWELWQSERLNRYNLKKLRQAEQVRDQMCPDGQCQKPDELPLWEERQLRMESWEKQHSLEEIQREADQLQAGKLDTDIQIRLRDAEKEVEIYQKAYEASRLDTERLCPGRLFTVDPSVKANGSDLKARMEYLTCSIEEMQQEVKLMREWIAQLPDSVHQARQAAQDEVDKMDEHIERLMEQSRRVTLSLEKGKAE